MRRGAACALLLVAALAAGCGSDNSKQDAAAAAHARAQARLHARAMVAGKRVFAGKCASCHTLEGRVAHPTFLESPIPNLDKVKPRVEYVRERVEDGGFDMPLFTSELSSAQIAAVATYVAEIAGRDVTDTSRDEPAAVTAGEGVFREHCQRCHSIGGRAATNRPSPPYPGTDFDRVKPSQQMVIERATRGIPGQMPAFGDKLTSAQIHALAVYVTATAGN